MLDNIRRGGCSTIYEEIRSKQKIKKQELPTEISKNAQKWKTRKNSKEWKTRQKGLEDNIYGNSQRFKRSTNIYL